MLTKVNFVDFGCQNRLSSVRKITLPTEDLPERIQKTRKALEKPSSASKIAPIGFQDSLEDIQKAGSQPAFYI